MIHYEDDKLEAKGSLQELTIEWVWLTQMLITNISEKGNIDTFTTKDAFINFLENLEFEDNIKGEINE